MKPFSSHEHRIDMDPSNRMGITASQIRIGVGGWTFEPWRGVFYPPGLPHGRELEYASGKLTSIEINGTYYRSQTPETFSKWHDETPDDFIFSVKAPRFATNRRSLAEAGPSIERFFTSGLLELKEKLGPINWQFMPTKTFDQADFEAFLRLLPKSLEGRDIRHAIEVRHESFKTSDFISLARDNGVAIVIAGDSSKYPLISDVTANFVYARIMGTSDDLQHGYSDAALDRWAARARIWAAGGQPADLKPIIKRKSSKSGRDVFLYVISGAKIRNPAAAAELIKRLA
jgi:uncharacterized protein YecE (DUF72 family)